MLPAQRRQLILETILTGRGAGVVELAERFAVSEMTVRRDLGRLAREGKLTRVHGGAVRDRDEPPFAEIATERRSEKERIGRAAARLVGDGQTIMVDIGTTTLELARQLRGRRLTVITSNLAVVEELFPESSIELVVLGGVVRRNYRSLVGMLAEDALSHLAADVAFLGASGIRSDLAVMDTTMVEVPIKRAMIAAAQRTVLLVDEAKFGMLGSVRICGPAEIGAVVTDAHPGHPGVAALEQAGVEVVHA
jgi:DeoR/GlpR family transcriptional regulator of sugar metabolism